MGEPSKDRAAGHSPGAVIWMFGRPSAGKTSICRAIQRLGRPDEVWLQAGDDQLARQIPPGFVVPVAPDDDGEHPPGWRVPMRDGVVVDADLVLDTSERSKRSGAEAVLAAWRERTGERAIDRYDIADA